MLMAPSGSVTACRCDSTQMCLPRGKSAGERKTVVIADVYG
jgi:hypothetical protein